MKERSKSKFTVTVVGGAGKMGLLLSRILKDRVGAVRISSRDSMRAKEAAESLGVDWVSNDQAHTSDIVVVSVPIDQTVEMCQNLGQRMSAHSLLVDIASVKTGITDVVVGNTPSSVEYLSLHPLFGPQVMDIRGRRCIAVEARGGPLTEEFLKILSECGASVRRSTVEDHDKAMAVIQVLHHHALLVFSSSLNKVAPNMGLSEYVTESLEKTLQNLESMQLNWETISAIQKCNPYAQQVREAFAQTANEMLSFNENSRAKLQNAISLLRSP